MAMKGISLKRLDDVQKDTKLKHGNHTLGRGPLLHCTDTRVSRKHANLGILDDGEITLALLHDNPCFYKKENEPDFKVLKKNETVKLHLGDEFQLSPDSYCYRIEQGGFLADDSKDESVEEEGAVKDHYELSTQVLEKNKESSEAVKAEEESKGNKEGARKLPDWMLTSEEIGQKSPKKRQKKADEHEHSQAKKAKQDTEETETETLRRPCQYGQKCYRQNPTHKEEFSHPGDSDWQDSETTADTDEAAEDLPQCPYGTSCYRRNPKHRSEYKHTQPPQNQANPSTPRKKRTTRRKAKDEDEHESSGDDDYDYEDPFIDDDTDEIDEDSDDEDWELTEKDKKREAELDPQLLDEEQWRAEPEDEPEVLELLKEAKDFLRNKKMQKH